MHGAAVVPEHDVSFCPFMTINEGVGRAVRIERVEKIGTFLLVHIDHVFEDLSTEIKCLSTGLRMGADNRVLVAGQTIALCVAELKALWL